MAAVLKQGVWQASSTYLDDTLGFILTLGYIPLNLALFGPRRRKLRVREPGVLKGLQGPGVPGDTVMPATGQWLGPGNTNPGSWTPAG